MKKLKISEHDFSHKKLIIVCGDGIDKLSISKKDATKNGFAIHHFPEYMKHPKKQILFARDLVEMINSNQKVILFTHSDYIIKELNNMCMLNAIYKKNKNWANELMEEMHYTQNHLLDFECIANYYLEEDYMQKIEVDFDGTICPSIEDAIDEINHNSKKIFYLHEDLPKTLKLEITEIINGKNATSREKGNLVFEAVKSEIEKGNKVMLSFSGLEVCTHTFISGSIGKIYKHFRKKIVDDFFEYFGVELPYWEELIQHYILLETNAEYKVKYESSFDNLLETK